MKSLVRIAVLAMAALLIALPAKAQDKRFLLATTTSTENSGLLDALIPQFTEATGIAIDVVAVGTGQAMEMGRRGDAAAILVHDRAGEEQFVANGYGTDRRDVMYNDFVIVGPSSDPAGLRAAKTPAGALALLADTNTVFVSRGDDSGTHRKERRIWAEAGRDVAGFGGWYRETGAGMGQTLLTTIQMDGYTMTDRATWTKFNLKDGYDIVFEGHPPISNFYASIVVTNPVVPAKETQWATQWHQWLTGEAGRQAIRNYKVDGQQLFFIAGDETHG